MDPQIEEFQVHLAPKLAEKDMQNAFPDRGIPGALGSQIESQSR